MSLFSSIGKAIRRGVKSVRGSGLLGTVASIALPGVGGALIGGALDGGGSSPSRLSALPASTTAPASRTVSNIPVPGMGGAISRALPGGDTGYVSRRKFKVGKLSGQPIPHGFHEKMSPQGTIYLVKTRRRRGITYRDLQTYRRVGRVLKKESKRK